jgi:hypothetical protein
VGFGKFSQNFSLINAGRKDITQYHGYYVRGLSNKKQNYSKNDYSFSQNLLDIFTSTVTSF